MSSKKVFAVALSLDAQGDGDVHARFWPAKLDIDVRKQKGRALFPLMAVSLVGSTSV